MKQRCVDSNHASWPNYGERGISVCERWINNFQNFLDDMGEPDPGLTIERRNNDGDYEPANCRWATLKEQAQNKRNNRILTHDGVSMTITEWEEKTGISRSTIKCRIDRSWSVERALTTELPKTRKVDWGGKSMSISEWANEVGIAKGTLNARISRGWTAERALTTPVR